MIGNTRVLVVDDQQEIHDDFRDILLSPHPDAEQDELSSTFLKEDDRSFLPAFELLHASNGEDACARIAAERSCPIAVAFIDIRMPPGIDGVETVRRIRQIDRNVEIVIMTAYAEQPLSEIVRDMVLLDKLLYIRKPFAREEVQQIALSLVTKWNGERELARQQQELGVSHRRLEAVLNATGDAIAMYDTADRLVFANRWYQQLAELTQEDLRRMSPEAVTAHFRERFRKPRLSVALEKRLVDGSNAVAKPVANAAQTKLFVRTEHPVRDPRDTVIGDLMVYRDVSSEIEVEHMKQEVQRLQAELEETYSFAGIVGASAGMQQVYALIRQAAAGDIPILIRGESGTGKELVAKALHFNGRRKTGPFLAVNCAAVPETLVESELFGHERGAFSGALTRHIGCFERANGGTLLLDEIADMRPALQAKLLRVLQEQEIQRVGGTTTIPIDVQVIAATNRDPLEVMRRGGFRKDLYYRIAAYPIVIPPLRERREDIPLLAEHFLKRYAERYDRAVHDISREAMRLLLLHDWPGNVRELQAAIGRGVLLETTGILQHASLPPELAPTAPGGGAQPKVVKPLAQVERRALAHALTVSGDSVAAAAQALEIDRSTLYRKLKKHGLPLAGG